jgi:hypothetical protein
MEWRRQHLRNERSGRRPALAVLHVDAVRSLADGSDLH